MESKFGDDAEKSSSLRNQNGNQVPYADSDRDDIPIQDMVTSESKTPITGGDGDNQVKFIGSDLMNEVNGDAKIDMDHVKACFTGLSKDELLQYVNDPFWVKTRMFLFVFFWITWIAMLIGAVAIIVVAPKCEPPKWYNQGPLYDVDIKSFLNAPAEAASGLLNTFIDKLPYIASLNMKGIIMSPIYKTDAVRGNNEDVVDFKAIDDSLGTLDDFKNLVKEATAKDLHVILSLVPNHSSDKHVWFNKSISRIAPYDNYYIWENSKGTDADGSRLPPNNWLSVTGGSAWEWNEQRQQYYLHQFDVNQPDLNFRNPHVLREMNETLSFWMNLGISGFNLKKSQYLLEDRDLQNEQISRSKEGIVHTDYDFYYHSKTYNLPENAALLTQWREIVHNANPDGTLIITGEAPIPSDSNETTVSVDMVRMDRLGDLPQNFTVTDLYPRLQKLVQSADSWPAFQIGDSTGRGKGSFREEDLDGLSVITLLLKGMPVITSGEESSLGVGETGPRTNETGTPGGEAKDSRFKMMRALLKAKESKAVVYGSSHLTVLNDTVIVLTRIKAGNPGYLAAYNLGAKNVTVDFTAVEHIPAELMVYTTSVNYGVDGIEEKDKVESCDFVMTPRSAVVFTFVPNIEETN